MARGQGRGGFARSVKLQDDVLVQSGCQVGFRRGQPGYHCRNIEGDGVHECIIAALLEEMKDFKETASFESCETEFGCSGCITQGSLGAPTPVDEAGEIRAVRTLKKSEKLGAHDAGSGRRGLGSPDHQHFVGGQFLGFQRKYGGPATIDEELGEELVSKGMEPKQASLWWTSTYA